MAMDMLDVGRAKEKGALLSFKGRPKGEASGEGKKDRAERAAFIYGAWQHSRHGGGRVEMNIHFSTPKPPNNPCKRDLL